MALQLPLSIKNARTNSIAQEVDGNLTGSKSLLSLSNSAGLAKNMKAFVGYTSGVTRTVQVEYDTTGASYKSYDIFISPLQSGNKISLLVSYRLESTATSGSTNAGISFKKDLNGTITTVNSVNISIFPVTTGSYTFQDIAITSTARYFIELSAVALVGSGVTNTSSFELTSATNTEPGSTDSYVIGINKTGIFSVSESETTPPPTVPNAPSNLTASYVDASVEVTLRWTDNSTNEDGFKIEKKTGTGNYVLAGTVTGTLWIDLNVLPGNSYSYRVYSYIGTTNSTYSNEVIVLIPIDGGGETIRPPF